MVNVYGETVAYLHTQWTYKLVFIWSCVSGHLVNVSLIFTVLSFGLHQLLGKKMIFSG